MLLHYFRVMLFFGTKVHNSFLNFEKNTIFMTITWNITEMKPNITNPFSNLFYQC